MKATEEKSRFRIRKPAERISIIKIKTLWIRYPRNRDVKNMFKICSLKLLEDLSQPNVTTTTKGILLLINAAYSDFKYRYMDLDRMA